MRIRDKFITPVILSVCLVLAGIGVLQTVTLYRNSVKELEQKAEHLAVLISLSNSTNLWNFDIPNVRTTLDAFFDDPEVHKIIMTVYYVDDDEIIRYARDSVATKTFAASEDIAYHGRPLGEVYVEISDEIVMQQVEEAIFSNIIIIIVLSVILFLPIVATSVIVTRPITALKNGFDRLAAGDFDIELQPNTNDEVGSLIEYFNDMVVNLKEKIRTEKEYELEKQNQALSLRWIAELEEKNEELRSSHAELKEVQKQMILSEKMAVLGGLVAGISHEINTPLGVCVTALSYFEDIIKKLKEQYEEGGITDELLVEHISKSCEVAGILSVNIKRAAELIQSFKKISVDQTSGAARTIELAEYIEETVMSLQPKIKTKDVSLKLDVPKDLQVHTYPSAFSQMLSNFIINTLDHGFDDREGGEIAIIVGVGDEQLCLEYRDNGKGMCEADRNKVFDPFFTNKRKAGGTGLGTYVVYNIVTQQLKGTITCSSCLHEGTTFTITIPIKEKENILYTL